MKLYINTLRQLGAAILIALGLLCLPVTAAEKTATFFDKLQHRLIDDGFKSIRIKRLYADQQVFFESRGVSLYFLHSEATLNYKKMAKRSWIKQGKAYKKLHAGALHRADALLGVDPDIITAIILVETKFGRYLGKRSIINTLSTMAALTESEPREYLWTQLPKKRRIERNSYDQKADRKAQWAYKELKAFLTYTERHKVDTVSIKGSYAGALGIAQFMPSSILAYGRDGNGDGRIDLFEHTDAIFSIASYLKHFGWKRGISRKKAYKVIYHYNHSKYYVNSVLKIAGLLKD